MLADEELDHANSITLDKAPKITVHASNGREPSILIRASASVDRRRTTVAFISPKRGKYTHLYQKYADTLQEYYERKSQRAATVGGDFEGDRRGNGRIKTVDAVVKTQSGKLAIILPTDLFNDNLTWKGNK